MGLGLSFFFYLQETTCTAVSDVKSEYIWTNMCEEVGYKTDLRTQTLQKCMENTNINTNAFTTLSKNVDPKQYSLKGNKY